MTTSDDVKFIDVDPHGDGNYDTRKVETGSGKFVNSLVVTIDGPRGSENRLFTVTQDSSTNEIGLHSITFDEKPHLTDNGKITIDHSYSTTAVVRLAFESNSENMFMCSHEISGSTQTFYDAIPTKSADPIVTMADSI